MSRDDVTIGIDIGTTAVKAVAADDNGRVTARVRIGHQLAVPAPDRLEHDADEAWRRGPLAALDRLVGPDTRALAVAAMVPSLTAVDPAGRPITPGLLYGDARGRVPNASVARAQSVPSVGETAEFLRWTAGQALDASGYWPAPAVANYALSGEAVIDYATAVTTLPLFDGTGWNATACADCGVTVDRMPRVETFGVGVGQVRGTGAVRRRRVGAMRRHLDRVDHHLRGSSSAGFVDHPAYGTGQEPDRRGQQRWWVVPQLGGSCYWTGRSSASRSAAGAGVAALYTRRAHPVP